MKHRTEYDMRLIGENLRRCREAKNLSVEDVKEYLRIGSVQAIYKWEEGRNYPQTDTMFALMELYEVGLEEILREREMPSYSLYFYHDNQMPVETEATNVFDFKRKKQNRVQRFLKSEGVIA